MIDVGGVCVVDFFEYFVKFVGFEDENVGDFFVVKRWNSVVK